MKALVFTALFLVAPKVFAMGDPSILFQAENSPLSDQERQHINDFTETTAGINQFTADRGHKDQQHMEDKEFARLREEELEQEKKLIIEKEVPKEVPEDAPIKRPSID